MPDTQTNTSILTRLLVTLAVIAALMVVMVERPVHASTTFTVNSPQDSGDQSSGDGKCQTGNILKMPQAEECTLRAAIQEANATPGVDTINFGILGTGVHTIQVNSGGYGTLPEITDPVTISGYTQPDSSPNTLNRGTNAKLTIRLDGSAIPGRAGLYVNGPDVVVKGLVFDNFSTSVEVQNNAASTRIEGNFIGTDPSGTTAQGNSYAGVLIDDSTAPTNNTVGGSDPAARNIISGNAGPGVLVSRSSGNKVYGNLIGTQYNGRSPLGNIGSGVVIFTNSLTNASNNSIGSTDRGYANTIAFNGSGGVSIYDDGSASTTVLSEAVLSNSIFSNKGLGVDLAANGVTPNDAGDGDVGANDLQNKPVLSSAKKGAGKTTIQGKLNSKHDRTFKIQFFKNPKGTDEGKTLLGSKTVTTDGSGNVSFTFSTTKKVALEQNITATATNTSTGDTSEFSAPRKVVTF